jgi:hypothetical protein
MADQLEAKHVREIIQWLNSQPGVWAYKHHGDMYSQNGIPDIVGIWRGVGFGMEVKRKGEYLRPLQRHMLRQIAEANGGAFVVHNLAEAQQAIEGWGTERPPHWFE